MHRSRSVKGAGSVPSWGLTVLVILCSGFALSAQSGPCLRRCRGVAWAALK